MENKEKEGPKVVIHIETAYNVNPAATVVNNLPKPCAAISTAA